MASLIWVNFGSGNGLSSNKRQAITWNKWWYTIDSTHGNKLRWNLNRNTYFFLNKMRLKLSSANLCKPQICCKKHLCGGVRSWHHHTLKTGDKWTLFPTLFEQYLWHFKINNHIPTPTAFSGIQGLENILVKMCEKYVYLMALFSLLGTISHRVDRHSHYKGKTISRPSYRYIGNSHSWKDHFDIETGPISLYSTTKNQPCKDRCRYVYIYIYMRLGLDHGQHDAYRWVKHWTAQCWIKFKKS